MKTKPVVDTTFEDNFTTDKVRGSAGNDHLIHNRDLSVDVHSGTGMTAYAGDDILEGSVPRIGQIHMMASEGDDWMILDTTKLADAVGVQGHHAYGGHGQDVFQFTNIANNAAPIVGRLDDFDPTSDSILIENTEINLADLPASIGLPNGDMVDVRVIEVDHPEFSAENLGAQHFLAIGDNIFYALEGARDLQNGTSGLTGEERHFLDADAIETLRSAETVQYENPGNFVPRDFYEHREDDLNLDRKQTGEELWADTGNDSAAHMFGAKSNPDAESSAGAQVMHGGTGDDVIDANTGNDTVYGGAGDDLIATGIDNDLADGGPGDDMIWGGDGDDTLTGGIGNDYLHGGRGDDVLLGGDGHDTIFGAEGNNTLTGGGGPDAINRFHFYEEGGDDTITDFKLASDLITLQDDVDPLTVELYEDGDGNTVLNYAETGSVQLRGVALDDFKQSAGMRAEEDNPIITIATDPEEEMLQELRIETGVYGVDDAPDLMVEGVQYGDTAFQQDGAGGYAYVSEDEIKNDPATGTSGETNGEEEFEPASEIPSIDEEEDEDEDDTPDQQEEDAGGGSCFVATAAYRDPWHPDVKYLRAFRDQWLVHRAWGRAFVAFYWRVGPVMAAPVRRNAWLGRPSKLLIAGIVRLLQRVWVKPLVAARTDHLASPSDPVAEARRRA